MKGHDIGWEKDAVVDCSDLWDLDAYRLLPRLPMDFPVVSIDDPDVVCFLVSEHNHIHDRDGDKTTWSASWSTREPRSCSDRSLCCQRPRRLNRTSSTG